MYSQHLIFNRVALCLRLYFTCESVLNNHIINDYQIPKLVCVNIYKRLLVLDATQQYSMFGLVVVVAKCIRLLPEIVWNKFELNCIDRRLHCEAEGGRIEL